MLDDILNDWIGERKIHKTHHHDTGKTLWSSFGCNIRGLIFKQAFLAHRGFAGVRGGSFLVYGFDFLGVDVVGHHLVAQLCEQLAELGLPGPLIAVLDFRIVNGQSDAPIQVVRASLHQGQRCRRKERLPQIGMGIVFGVVGCKQLLVGELAPGPVCRRVPFEGVTKFFSPWKSPRRLPRRLFSAPFRGRDNARLTRKFFHSGKCHSCNDLRIDIFSEKRYVLNGFLRALFLLGLERRRQVLGRLVGRLIFHGQGRLQGGVGGPVVSRVEWLIVVRGGGDGRPALRRRTPWGAGRKQRCNLWPCARRPCTSCSRWAFGSARCASWRRCACRLHGTRCNLERKRWVDLISVPGYLVISVPGYLISVPEYLVNWKPETTSSPGKVVMSHLATFSCSTVMGMFERWRVRFLTSGLETGRSTATTWENKRSFCLKTFSRCWSHKKNKPNDLKLS